MNKYDLVRIVKCVCKSGHEDLVGWIGWIPQKEFNHVMITEAKIDKQEDYIDDWAINCIALEVIALDMTNEYKVAVKDYIEIHSNYPYVVK